MRYALDMFNRWRAIASKVKERRVRCQQSRMIEIRSVRSLVSPEHRLNRSRRYRTGFIAIAILCMASLSFAQESFFGGSEQEQPGTEAPEDQDKGDQDKSDQVQPLLEKGIAAYKAGNYQEAVAEMTQVRALAPSNSPSALYLGLAYLKLDQPEKAVAAWRAYTKLEPSTDEERDGDLKTAIAQNLAILVRTENHEMAKQAIEHEKQYAQSDHADAETVAVAYCNNLGSARLNALRKGLTALLIDDLAKVRTLKVVERERIQAILDEMKLQTSSKVDKTTAARMGRLLRAGRVVTGSYLDLDEQQLRMDSTVAESSTGKVIGTQEAVGELKRFFEVEKQLAFALLKDLNYDEQKLTPEEVETIKLPQTTSVEALTAFSQGLDAEDHDDFTTALNWFQQALQWDPGFNLPTTEVRFLRLGFHHHRRSRHHRGDHDFMHKMAGDMERRAPSAESASRGYRRDSHRRDGEHRGRRDSDHHDRDRGHGGSSHGRHR
jgi:tetratricopeptide (TPR) repeat protein